MCLEKSLLIWVNLGNAGASPLTAGATLSVYGKMGMTETLLGEQPFVGQLDAGKYAEAIGFQIDGEGYEQVVIRATANEEECKLDNNALTLEPPFCNPPG